MWTAKQANGTTTSHMQRWRSCVLKSQTKLLYQWWESVSEYHLILNTDTYKHTSTIKSWQLRSQLDDFKQNLLSCVLSVRHSLVTATELSLRHGLALTSENVHKSVNNLIASKCIWGIQWQNKLTCKAPYGRNFRCTGDMSDRFSCMQA